MNQNLYLEDRSNAELFAMTAFGLALVNESKISNKAAEIILDAIGEVQDQLDINLPIS